MMDQMARRDATPKPLSFARRYVYIASVDRLWDRQARQYIQVHAAARRHAAEMPEGTSAYHVLMAGPDAVDKVDAVTFSPGQRELVEEDGGIRLNFWTPVTLQPRTGSVWPFLRHLARIVDGEAAVADLVLDYVAHLVQRPAVKIESALLFIGLQGTGKSILTDIFREVVGRQNTRSITANDLSSPFNGWVGGTLLTVVDEVVSDHSRATAARLKSLITNPTVRVNEKNIPAFDMRNCNHIVMLSNDFDAAIIDRDDRRQLVAASRALPAPASYFAYLCRWLRGGGYGRVLNFLQTRDISRFDPCAPPPRTAGRAELVGYSRSDLETYLVHALEAGEAPFVHDLVVVNHVAEYLRESRRMPVSVNAVGKFLRSAGAECLGQKRIRGTKPHVWAIRHVQRWNTAPEDEIAAAYQRPDEAVRAVRESAPMPVRRSRSLNDL